VLLVVADAVMWRLWKRRVRNDRDIAA